MLSDKIKRKNQENDKKKTFKRMSIIFDIKKNKIKIKIKWIKLKKKQFKTKKDQ
jgi:hypothetical protein